MSTMNQSMYDVSIMEPESIGTSDESNQDLQKTPDIKTFKKEIKFKRNGAIFPMTLKMIYCCTINEDNQCFYQDQMIKNIQFIGRLVQYKEQDNYVIYTLEDSIGTIDVLKERKEEQNSSTFYLNEYIHVIGQLHINEQSYFGITPLRLAPLYDMNEYYHYLLHIMFLKISTVSPSPTKSNFIPVDRSVSTPHLRTSLCRSTTKDLILSSLHQQILEALDLFNDLSEDGVPSEELFSLVQQQYSISDSQFAQSIKELKESGYLFSLNNKIYKTKL